MRPRACLRLAAVAIGAASLVGCGGSTDEWSTLPEAVGVTPMLWLRADSVSGVSGTPVVGWPATVGPDAVQSNPALQPKLSALRGRAAIQFDGEDDVLEANLNINPSVHHQLTIVAVFSSDVDTGRPLRKLYGADDGGYDRTAGLDDRAENGKNYTVFAGEGPDDVGYFDLTAGGSYLTVDQFDVGVFNGWVSGRHALQDQPTNHGDGLSTFFIGGTGTVFSEPWKGTIAELLAFDGVLLDSQREALEDFLGRKYTLVIDHR